MYVESCLSSHARVCVLGARRGATEVNRMETFLFRVLLFLGCREKEISYVSSRQCKVFYKSSSFSTHFLCIDLAFLHS